MDKRYLQKREKVAAVFVPENIISDSRETVLSPSGRFELEIVGYATGPNSWHYSRGRVRRLSDNKIIADIKRNYGHFWHSWVNHPNGNEYLLCGEDYQGYSVVNLTADTYTVFFPEEGYQGLGFCWGAAYPSQDGLVIAVDGCYWACPYEMVFYDFTDPEVLPLPEIDRIDGCRDPVIGWINNNTFVFTVSYQVRKADGKKYSDLTDDEQAVIDADYSLMTERDEKIEWCRPV